ncbi:hypothetical protein I8H89_01110 [Candidatus Saccharibacteria bacterium]|nr:hypothetical protein [Candidatus Saccharibacteria bacterium]
MTQTWYPLTGALKRRGRPDGGSRDSLVPGTYKPNATNTGLLNDPARPMTVIDGNVIMTTNGQKLVDTIVNGFVEMRGVDQLVENCHIRGPVGQTVPPGGSKGLIHCSSAGTLRATIKDTLIECQTPQYGWDAIQGHDYTALRVRTRRTTDGFGVFNATAPDTPVNVTILSCWVENMTKFYPDGGAHVDGTHNDCIQLQGGVGGIVIRGNLLQGVIDQNTGNTGGLNVDGTGTPLSPACHQTNSCIQLNRNVGELSGMVCEDNWMYGGQIAVNGTAISTAVTLGSFQRNKFDHDQYFDVAQQGTNTTQTIRIHPTPTCTIPASGANANVYEDTSAPVLVRRAT